MKIKIKSGNSSENGNRRVPQNDSEGSYPKRIKQIRCGLIAIFGIFYFLIIAPQRKRQRALQDMIGSLKPGDRIVTSGGIIGTVESATIGTDGSLSTFSAVPMVNLMTASDAQTSVILGGSLYVFAGYANAPTNRVERGDLK